MELYDLHVCDKFMLIDIQSALNHRFYSDLFYSGYSCFKVFGECVVS